jgi:KDO2-lipid IV(A) lauroyltransferase
MDCAVQVLQAGAVAAYHLAKDTAKRWSVPQQPKLSDPPDVIRGTFGQWISDRVVRAMITCALALPLRVRLTLFGAAVSRIIAPFVGYQKRAEDNLLYVWPHLSSAERRRIARAVANQAGRTIIENYDMHGLKQRMAQVPLQGAGVDALKSAQRDRTPVVLVTGHYGNFEAARAALVARGYQIGGLYRPMRNPYFNSHYAANMHSMSGPVFAQGRRGTAGLVRHIRDGGMAVLLFDIYSSKGLPLPFLGKPAPTMLSAAEIALRTNALLIPFFAIRRSDGQNFDVVFETPVAHSDPEAMMREVTTRLEARIEAQPEQWFWIHRRWKPERQKNTSLD